ncbi:hypothetical protein WJX84_006342 [Apatococcus fuscideae]|uniref:Branchpoint-bridging protein n=1 Tax=Apatococcus fuscideae TaxID=2026836 RepID=A0AAW1SQF9_9CHLO
MQLAAQQAAERFNQQFAAQQAQQPLTPEPAEPSQPSAPAANGSADYAAQPFQTFEQNGTQAASLPPVPVLVAATPADGAGGGRKRRNRWGPKEGEAPAAGQEQAPDASEGGVTPPPAEEPGKKKRRSRWEEPAPEPSMALANVGAGAFPKELVLPGGIKVALPSALTGQPTHDDPLLKELHDQLNECNRKILNNELDILPEGERSPSPEPIYDRNGQRQNTREVRSKDKLMNRRSELIEELIKNDPTYRPPNDYRPPKKHRKIFIPQSAYPGYNFIGLIIGPRGNTQKRMQKETNTKIAIRGKGSVKEGASRDPKYDYGEEEELHVLITGDTQNDVDAAAEMIENLLVPTDEARNEHKRLQLRELAALNGTLKDDQHCYLCGQSGHRQFECPNKPQDEIYKLPTEIQEKVDQLYQRDINRTSGEGPAPRLDDEYKSFLAELGGGMGGGAPPSGAAGPSGSGGPGMGAPMRGGGPGIGMPGMDSGMGGPPRGPRMRPGDELPDDCKLYVGNLSQNVDDRMLRRMFESFGNVLHAVVINDQVTGQSRGFGFVHLDNPNTAAAASQAMSGKMVDSRALVVRIRSDGPPKPGLGGGPGGFDRGPRPGLHDNDDSKLYVANLPQNVDEAALERIFAPFGQVVGTRIICDRETGAPKGYAFVTLQSPAQAQNAMRGMAGYRIMERPITVKIAGQGRGGPPELGRGYGMQQQQPPLPTDQPPMPGGVNPPLPRDEKVQKEYERFMSEMGMA